ncbi:MAG: nicotinate-nucleotide--dimethylbenzimidazole phosphoribosyltransferase [Chloroflexi bacterium]|nr:nicotinate-nucleotide--dimethylbenzimidazole phosphoribosyltransferase [Chloroflexota bacterium]
MSIIEETIKRVRPLDEEAIAAARGRQEELTKPSGSLGRLEHLATQVAGIMGNPLPSLSRKVVFTFAADHGVAAEGVSAYPSEVTAQMVYNFLRRGAAINVLAAHVGARVVVVDIGVAADVGEQPGLVRAKVADGTRNMAVGPAMTRSQALEALEAGVAVLEAEMGNGIDIIGTGDMGIANTTTSSAIVAALTGAPVHAVTGRGTGIGPQQLLHKVQIIERALAVNQPDPRDPLDVLAKVGGLEIGGLAGLILAAAANRIPVVVDGFISGAAALLAWALCPAVQPYLIAAHQSVEIGHQVTLRHLGLTPLLDLSLRLGEGTGAALGISIVEAAVRCLTEMATFAEAQVAQASERRETSGAPEHAG